ncbi:TPA: AzlD domain-containing protein [Streptococcus agalactiae]|nr:AzlD domain-containing protein [Streptococcus agalactiae]
MINSTVFLAILLGFVVSWVPRVAPFIFVKYKGLPNSLVKFLKFLPLPLSILFALTFSSFFSVKLGQLPTLKWLDLLAGIPTLVVTIRYRNLFYTVLTGIVTMALLRLLF